MIFVKAKLFELLRVREFDRGIDELQAKSLTNQETREKEIIKQSLQKPRIIPSRQFVNK